MMLEYSSLIDKRHQTSIAGPLIINDPYCTVMNLNGLVRFEATSNGCQAGFTPGPSGTRLSRGRSTEIADIGNCFRCFLRAGDDVQRCKSTWSLTTIIDRVCLAPAGTTERGEEKVQHARHFNVAASRLSARLGENVSGGKSVPRQASGASSGMSSVRRRKLSLRHIIMDLSSTARVPPFVLPSPLFSPTQEAVPCNQQWLTGKTPSQSSTSSVRLAPFSYL